MALLFIVQQEGVCQVTGLSTDTKPVPQTNDWRFFEVDTAKTYTASGGLWVESFGGTSVIRSNYVVIRSLADFPAPVLGVITLQDFYTYEINGSVDIGTNRIQFGIKNTVLGIDRLNDKLVSQTTATMFVADSTVVNKFSVLFSELTLQCPNGQLLGFILTGLSINQCSINSTANLGTISAAPSVTVRNTGMVNGVSTVGFTFLGAGGQLQIRDNVTTNNANILFNLAAATFNTISVSRNNVTVNAGQTFLSGLAAGANVVSLASLSDNIFTGAGTAVAGITRTDNKWTWSDNLGVTNTSVPIPNFTRTPVVDVNYTALLTDNIISYTLLTASHTVFLPSAVSAGAGKVYIIKDESGTCANQRKIFIDANGAELIDGVTFKELKTAYASMSLYCTGTGWSIY